MDREKTKQEIRSRISCKDYLKKSASGMYCCPFCGSGNGSHKTGALKLYDTNTWTCHACNRTGDVIDLYQNQTGADYSTALSLLAESIGITIESDYVSDPDRPIRQAENSVEAENSPGTDQSHIVAPASEESKKTGTEEVIEADYTAYYKECRERLKDPAAAEYLNSRGISVETAEAYYIGFDPEADPANAPGAMPGTHKPHPCPRIILPSSKGFYVGRRIDGGEEYKKLNPKGATPTIFNIKALYKQEVQEVFICEGFIDALSVLEIGQQAIGLNSTNNAETLIKKLEEKRAEVTFIISLDNDESGKKATETLRAGFSRLNIPFIVANISGSFNDPNEALVKDKEAFKSAIEQAQRQTAAKPDNTANYIDTLMSEEIERFKDDKKTGFSALDAKAGGLYTGLYVLAAISSLGKTSFALQLADQLAESGNDVIFFSLEQSRLELVSKSIARRTAQADRKTAVTSLQIRKGYLPKQAIKATKDYKAAVADRISVVEGNFQCDISYIGNYVRRYIKQNNTRPIVFIDYLQILQPAEDKRQTTKEVIDTTITELKRLSREQDLIIVAISSVNRTNYLTPIDFESLKESGSIEYSADVIWGLQLQVLNDEIFTQEKKTKEKRDAVKEAKAATPRKIELSCLKNRYGISSYSVFFDYYPANDLFEEDQQENGNAKQTIKQIGRSTALKF